MLRLDVYFKDGTHDTAIGPVANIEQYITDMADAGRASDIAHYQFS